MTRRFIIFLLLNSAALALGSLYTWEGLNSVWYLDLEKAPWSPPGWVFALAWGGVMICFSAFLAYVWHRAGSRFTVMTAFLVQWILNVSWNPVFFKYHMLIFALIIMSLLTIIVLIFQFGFIRRAGTRAWLVTPYLVWIILATSLNVYIVIFN